MKKSKVDPTAKPEVHVSLALTKADGSVEHKRVALTQDWIDVRGCPLSHAVV